MAASAPFDILLVGQAGRVGHEALLCVASIRAYDPKFDGAIYVADPQPGPLWSKDPGLPDYLRDALRDLSATILPFTNHIFGASYPNGNKIEALAALPPDRPFLFLDSDVLITGPLSSTAMDFSRPAASTKVRDTWPKPPLYGPNRAAIWDSLYRRFDLDITTSLNPRHPPEDWRHYLYRNAGWFYGPSGPAFGAIFARIAQTIRDDPPQELASQTLYPWLDQIALPLVLTALGGTRNGPDLDGSVLTHYRTLPLLFASAPDQTISQLTRLTERNRLKKHLKRYKPFHRALYRGEGAQARALFNRDRLPSSEAIIRNRLRRAGLWSR